MNTHKKPSNLVICLSNWGEWRVENPHNLPESFVDFGKGNEKFTDFLRRTTGLWISDGAAYGKAGEGFLRINVATPKCNVEDGLERLKKGVELYTR